MAQILTGSYMAVASVVCLNLYIALMSETFTRVYSNAKATAYMLQANHLLAIERTLGNTVIWYETPVVNNVLVQYLYNFESTKLNFLSILLNFGTYYQFLKQIDSPP